MYLLFSNSNQSVARFAVLIHIVFTYSYW